MFRLMRLLFRDECRSAWRHYSWGDIESSNPCCRQIRESQICIFRQIGVHQPRFGEICERRGGDGFHFVYRRLEGDGEIRARVVADARGSEVEAGLAIRRDLTADAPMAFVGNRSGRSLELRRSLRRVTPRSLEEKRGGSYWVRLVRDGKTVTAYRSDDGQLWKETGSGKMDLGPTAFVGFAATSAQDASPHPAVVFDNVIFIAAR